MNNVIVQSLIGNRIARADAMNINSRVEMQLRIAIF